MTQPAKLKHVRARWALYVKIQEGHIDLQEAPSRYRSALELHDADNDILIMGLQQLRIPIDQIRSNGRLASRGPPKPDPFNTSKSTVSETLKQDILHDEQSGPNIKKKIAQNINLYRSNILTLEDAIEKIEKCLSGIKSYPEDIEEILTDDTDDPTEAALTIRWDACDNDSDEEDDPRQKQNVVNASPSKEKQT